MAAQTWVHAVEATESQPHWLLESVSLGNHVAGGFLVTELERFRKVFLDFDSDDSGDMSKSELVSAQLRFNLCWHIPTQAFDLFGIQVRMQHGTESDQDGLAGLPNCQRPSA